MKFITKWCVRSENSGTHIISKAEDGSYACDCVGWTRHYPRITCKHIRQVLENHPEPLDQANWDRLNGKKKDVKRTLDILAKIVEDEKRASEVMVTSR